MRASTRSAAATSAQKRWQLTKTANSCSRRRSFSTSACSSAVQPGDAGRSTLRQPVSSLKPSIGSTDQGRRLSRADSSART
ncbi:hypothetical protein [Streptomyces sp. NPDC007905]|uniref:hypothetical protein n=1 Tax=Streptomyces sp. NPDC007905 TaxID=3364788 RepID=UPI0036E268E1